MAREQLPLFYDRGHAQGLIAMLEQRTEQLAGLIASRDRVSVRSASGQARRAALKRLLLDALMYLGPWGRDVTAGDAMRRERYALDKLFPAGRARKGNGSSAAVDDEALDAAAADRALGLPG
ncbi:MAG: hypothetical protein ABIJ09_00865 [Pseudomonadota bacterium]